MGLVTQTDNHTENWGWIVLQVRERESESLCESESLSGWQRSRSARMMMIHSDAGVQVKV